MFEQSPHFQETPFILGVQHNGSVVLISEFCVPIIMKLKFTLKTED